MSLLNNEDIKMRVPWLSETMQKIFSGEIMLAEQFGEKYNFEAVANGDTVNLKVYSLEEGLILELEEPLIDFVSQTTLAKLALVCQ